MERDAYILTIRPGMEARYFEVHRVVWPELIEAASRSGVRNHGSWVHERTVFIYLEAENLKRTYERLLAEPVKQKWDEFMSSILEPGSVPLEEAFHMD